MSLCLTALLQILSAGFLYASAQGVLTLTPGSTLTTLAGTGTAGYAGDGGTATAASLARPTGAAYDGAGNLFLADTNNHVIREVSSSGVITTVAGSGVAGFGGDGGSATAAFLDTPTAVAVDSTGNLFIADSHNHRIREVSGGKINTVAGNGTAGFSGDSGPATSARLALPSGIAIDTSGNLFIADTNNHRIRKVAAGTITTIAGNGEELFAGDAGPAIAASLDQPTGVAVDAAGNLYIADKNNQRIRVVNSAGVISTVAGNGAGQFAGAFSGDGGSATAAALAKPMGVSVAAAGNLLIADTNNQRIRQVAPNGAIITAAGTGDEGFADDGASASGSLLSSPRAVIADANGGFLIADTLNQRARTAALGQINFGAQAAGTTASPQPVTLSNTGTSSITIATLTVQGPFTTTAGGTCSAVPIALAPGASCTQDIAFHPAAPGQASGAVTAAGPNLVSQRVLLAGSSSSVSTSLLLAADKSSVLSGETVTLSATLSGPGGLAQSATGSVSFFAGSQLLGSSPVTGGKATLSTSSLPDGPQSLTAAFAGNPSFGAATSAAIAENVADLNLSFISQQAAAVVPGQSIKVPLTLMGSGASNINGTVTLAVPQPPAGLFISFAPATTALTNGQSTIAMNVTAAPTSTSAMVDPARAGGAGIGLAVLLLPFYRRRSIARKCLWRSLSFCMALIASIAMLGSMTGCGSNTGFFAQKQQTFTITVTATATDSSGGTISRNTLVPITVQ